MKLFARLRSRKETRKPPFPLRLEDHAPRSDRGQWFRGFSLLRHVGADLRHEEGRRNAGAKYRFRRRWEDL